MTTEITALSENLAIALTAELDRPPPFSREELDDVERLTLKGDPDFDASVLSNLRRLSLTDASQEAIDWLAGPHAPQLSTLAFTDSALDDLSPLIGVQRLAGLEIVGCQLTDATPLLDLDNLLEVDARRNPWNDHSWNDVFPRLEQRGVEVRRSGAVHREITCLFHAKGVPATLHGRYLIFPRGYMGLNQHRFKMSLDEARRLATQDTLSATDLVAEFGRTVPASVPTTSKQVTTEAGSAADALTWVTSSTGVSAGEREAFGRFLKRFSTLQFQRDLPSRFEAPDQLRDLGKPLHPKIRGSYEIVARFSSAARPGAPFEVYLGLAAHQELLPAETWWYIGMIDFGGELKPPHLHPVAYATGRIWLVYDERTDGIGYVASDELMTSGPVAPIYDSYPALLDDIVRVRPPGGREISAASQSRTGD